MVGAYIIWQHEKTNQNILSHREKVLHLIELTLSSSYVPWYLSAIFIDSA